MQSRQRKSQTSGHHAKPLSDEEIRRAFEDDELRRSFPPILSPETLACLLGISRSTVYFWISEGRLAGAFRRRGKHNLIWRDRAIKILFNGPEWSSS
jgi:excisionase family DNA binding protein